MKLAHWSGATVKTVTGLHGRSSLRHEVGPLVRGDGENRHRPSRPVLIAARAGRPHPAAPASARPSPAFTAGPHCGDEQFAKFEAGMKPSPAFAAGPHLRTLWPGVVDLAQPRGKSAAVVIVLLPSRVPRAVGWVRGPRCGHHHELVRAYCFPWSGLDPADGDPVNGCATISTGRLARRSLKPQVTPRSNRLPRHRPSRPVLIAARCRSGSPTAHRCGAVTGLHGRSSLRPRWPPGRAGERTPQTVTGLQGRSSLRPGGARTGLPSTRPLPAYWSQWPTRADLLDRWATHCDFEVRREARNWLCCGESRVGW